MVVTQATTRTQFLKNGGLGEGHEQVDEQRTPCTCESASDSTCVEASSGQHMPAPMGLAAMSGHQW